MDDVNTEHKIRSLKLKILQVEREINAKMHGSNLNAFLSVGHAGQIAKAHDREQKRLEAKLEDLRKQLAELDPSAVQKPSAKPAELPVLPKTPPAAVKERTAVKPKKAEPVKKTTAKPAAKTKAAAAKSAAASKPAKKPVKKK